MLGLSAASPSRRTAPGPALLLPKELLNQRWCPPTYTADGVASSAVIVSPPVRATHDGTAFAAGRFSKRATVSQGPEAPEGPPLAATTK